jgi:hypothetical protein
MNFHSTSQELLSTSRFVLKTYLSDLSDSEILVCPVDGAHHAAWQLGHLIFSESRMVNGVRVGSGIKLPNGFDEAHGKGKPIDSTEGFLGLAEYAELLERQRAMTIELLLSLDEASLEQPAPEFMRSYARTVSSVFLAIANHELLHAGQIAVIRRSLQKAVLI